MSSKIVWYPARASFRPSSVRGNRKRGSSWNLRTSASGDSVGSPIRASVARISPSILVTSASPMVWTCSGVRLEAVPARR